MTFRYVVCVMTISAISMAVDSKISLKYTDRNADEISRIHRSNCNCIRTFVNEEHQAADGYTSAVSAF